MCFLASKRVCFEIDNLLQISTIDFISIKPIKSSSLTHNSQVLLKRPKIIYFSQVGKQLSQIEKLFLNIEKNNCCQN